jgi:hypothetical protein
VTCIVGVIANARVWMGADSASGDTGQWHLTTARFPKLFTRDSLLIGYTSSWRMGQLLRWRLAIPPRPEGMDTHEWMATDFIDAVRECFKSGGIAKKENEVETGGTFLVACSGRLFTVGSDYQVDEPDDDMAAVGCGYSFALGAMHATTTLEPEPRLRAALEAAAYYSAYVRGPFRFASL